LTRFHVLLSDSFLYLFPFLQYFAVEFLILIRSGNMHVGKLGISGKGFDLIVFLYGSVITSESLLARRFRLRVESVDFLLGFDDFKFAVEFGG
jgi:hypothetical protein